MTIPIRNLYYLFCYAWARFPEGGSTEVGIEGSPDLPNLFAKVLVNGVNRLLRRGLDRGYVEIVEETRSPRGRLLIDRILKEQTLLRGAVVCQLDDFRRDVLHNQIIKATAVSLAKDAEIAVPLAHDLRVIARKLADISDIRLSGDAFRRVQLFRNNRQYAFLMRLCEFVYRSTLPSTDGSGSKFADILKDEEKISRIFEEFLRNFYFYHASEFSVASENMYWDAISDSTEALSLIPIMKTDVTLRSPSRIIVMDAKFYTEPFVRSYGAEKLRTGHLYQLYAYMKRAAKNACGTPVEGMLVYAGPSAGSSRRYEIDGHPVAVIELSLNRPWPEIHRELLEMISKAGLRLVA